MPSRPDSGFHFRDVGLAKFYDEIAGRDYRHSTAKRDLERYRLLLADALPKLTEEEAIAIWSALNSCTTRHAESLAVLRLSIANDCKPGLSKKMQSWTNLQWFAVVDACEQVGQGSNFTPDLEAKLFYVFFKR